MAADLRPTTPPPAPPVFRCKRQPWCLCRLGLLEHWAIDGAAQRALRRRAEGRRVGLVLAMGFAVGVVGMVLAAGGLR